MTKNYSCFVNKPILMHTVLRDCLKTYEIILNNQGHLAKYF